MKPLTKTKALAKLKKMKTNYQRFVRDEYEHKAKDCLTCEVQGICCTDAHFVNVHITRLEAVAITKALEKLDRATLEIVYQRVSETIEKYDLNDSGDTLEKKFACPLFEKGTGCLVHKEGKPLPCITHACYENKEDLPPNTVQLKRESAVELLNTRTFGNAWNWLPLPVWIRKIATERTENTEGLKSGLKI
ncbi:MAG: hypothetical protein HKN25_12160 [Pyrinomonadaceae bacterium]|nr:hypothetical protein [Pyrinomonadaceae bacterium]